MISLEGNGGRTWRRIRGSVCWGSAGGGRASHRRGRTALGSRAIWARGWTRRAWARTGDPTFPEFPFLSSLSLPCSSSPSPPSPSPSLRTPRRHLLPWAPPNRRRSCRRSPGGAWSGGARRPGALYGGWKRRRGRRRAREAWRWGVAGGESGRRWRAWRWWFLSWNLCCVW